MVSRRKKFYAHDEKNIAHIGDVVRIEETRPMSKLKRWRLNQIIRKSALVPEYSSTSCDAKLRSKMHRSYRRSNYGSDDENMLEVADNSGARKLQVILPLGGSTGLRRAGRRDHRGGERSFTRGAGAKRGR